ncbi:hypothetical protein SFB3_436G1, partial [Candidatus Arthromitus sp. SFB-3]
FLLKIYHLNNKSKTFFNIKIKKTYINYIQENKYQNNTSGTFEFLRFRPSNNFKFINNSRK